jgi:hypothetical protein
LSYIIQPKEVDELKTAALYVIRGMHIKTGRIVIDVSTSHNTAIVKITEISKKIKEGDEVTVSETRTIR